jgi:hypothetical protein
MKKIYFGLLMFIVIISCAELMRKYTTIIYTRTIQINNNLNYPVSIQLYDSICCDPTYIAEYIMGLQNHTITTINLDKNEKASYEYSVMSTLEYSTQSAIDTFNLVNSNYRNIAFHFKANQVDTIILIPWKSNGWNVTDLPKDTNSTADKIGINCLDTINLTDLIK